MPHNIRAEPPRRVTTYEATAKAEKYFVEGVLSSYRIAVLPLKVKGPGEARLPTGEDRGTCCRERDLVCVSLSLCLSLSVSVFLCFLVVASHVTLKRGGLRP